LVEGIRKAADLKTKKPEWKQRLEEIHRREMPIVLKVACLHNESFVDADNGDVVCTGCFAVLRFGSKASKKELETFCVSSLFS
jgi:hypothetical protein